MTVEATGTTVAVLSGGRSSEHEISLLSGMAVAEGLREAGFTVLPIEVGKDGSWRLGDDPSILGPGQGLDGVDVVFPVLHGPFGEDGSIQGLLDTLGLPYVGSGVLGSAVCMDKITLKRVCRSEGIPQVEFVEVGTPDWVDRSLALGSPVWVKPSRLGSSVGINRVEGGDREGLEKAVAEAAEHDPRVIIEANSNGREVEVSVLGNELPETSVPGEVIAAGDWYDFESKYSAGGMTLQIPAGIGDREASEARRLAAWVFRLAGCSGMARCDFFVEEDGRVLLNEVNTIPGFTEMSVYSRLWEASGLPYPELLTRLVVLAREREQERRGHSF